MCLLAEIILDQGHKVLILVIVSAYAARDGCWRTGPRQCNLGRRAVGRGSCGELTDWISLGSAFARSSTADSRRTAPRRARWRGPRRPDELHIGIIHWLHR